MAIGNQPSVAGLNVQAADAAVSLRNACQLIQQLFEFVSAEQTAGLQTIGFTAADATAYFNAVNYLNTVTAVYFGTATQTPAFNFDSALAVLRGGQ